MKNIKIEWKHYDKKGETCTRCNDTGQNIKLALKKLRKNPEYKKLNIEYLETKLEANNMAKSNSILINGKLIEDILGAKSSYNYCHSCSCLAGADTDCRTISIEDSIYEKIPAELIIDAIIKMA